MISAEKTEPELKSAVVMEPEALAEDIFDSESTYSQEAKPDMAVEDGTAVATPKILGAIDKIQKGRISGWAWSTDPLLVPLRVALVDGDTEVMELVADGFRRDLAESGFGSGECGFSVQLPAKLFDGQEHCFSLRCLSDNKHVAGAEKTIKLTKELAPPRMIPVDGAVDGIRGPNVEGWVQDPENPEQPIQVEVLHGDEVIAKGFADRYREDLLRAGKGKGECAFRVPLPYEYLDGRKLELKVRECASGKYVRGDKLLLGAEVWYEVKFKSLEEGVLMAEMVSDHGTGENPELELWIDGVLADRISTQCDADGYFELRRPVPEKFLDGYPHEFVLTPAGTSLVVAVGRFATPAKAYTYGALQVVEAEKTRELPLFVRDFIVKIAGSALFDVAFFSSNAKQEFATAEDAILYYLQNRHNWKYSTSPWLDVAFIHEISGGVTRSEVSPLEWYLRQGVDRDAGPNPLFSNADYQVFARLSFDAKPETSSFFDDWLEGAKTATATNPSALVDLEYVASHGAIGDGAKGACAVVDYLQSWLLLSPKKRPVDALHPCFDQDWLNQCFILEHNQPKGCLFSAFRLGRLVGQSPHPVLQQGRDQRNYYELIRNYEVLSFSAGIDDIVVVCPDIDADAFYAQFPRQVTGSVEGETRRSSLYRYLTSDAGKACKSFIKALDDGFVAAEYSGLAEYCLATSGIADINRIWSRWLRLLGLPGNYIDSMGRANGMLSIQDLAYLRSHRFRPESGISASFIIPSYGRDDLALRCVLSAVQSAGASNVEFLIAEDAVHVDGAWILGYFLPFAKIHKNPVNLGFLLSCNEAVQRSSGEIFVLVNNDVIVHKNALNEMLQTFGSQPRAAVVGGLVLNLDGTIQENGGMLWRDASAWNYHRNWKLDDEFLRNVREADYVSGCWIGVRRTVWDQLGGFDTRYVPAYCEESDFCMSCWHHGHKVYINPLSVVTHLDGATMGQDENAATLKSYQKINRVKLREKWRHLLTATHNENGKPTPFHTGRNDKKRFASVIFDHYLPEYDRDAGSRTVFAICEALASIENNYVLFVPANNCRTKYAAALERMGIEIVTGVEGWKRFDNLLEHHTDLIKYAFVSRIEVATKFKWHIDQMRGQKSIYIHDIEALRGFPYDPNSPGYEDLVAEAMAQYASKHHMLFSSFDHIVSCSEDETKLLETYFGNKIVDVFPYNHKSVSIREDGDRRNDIIFVGSYNHTPNRDAIEYFMENVWPGVGHMLPEARLHICGSGFENINFMEGRNVILHGHVSDQTLAYLYSISRLSIAPLITGAGIKGKVIEASANGVACVGTDVAWQGLAIPEGYAYLGGSMDTFAARLVQAHQSYNAEMAAALIEFHEKCLAHNNIAEVIPRLANPKGKY